MSLLTELAEKHRLPAAHPDVGKGGLLPKPAYNGISCKSAGDDGLTARPQKAPSLPVQSQALALEGFFGIMARWKVDNATIIKVLGSPAERTFYAWKSGNVGRVPEDTLRRIGYVTGIWKALQIIYSRPDHADRWVKKPNRFFGGHTPLERMAAGDVTDLAAVRAYVDAARAPWS